MRRVTLLTLAVFIVMAFSATIALSAVIYLDSPLDEDKDGIIEILKCTEFDINVLMDGIPSPGLTSYYLDLELDPLVEIVSVTPYVHPFMVSEIPPITARELPYAIGLNGLNLSAGVQGNDVLLATITFHCKDIGWTELNPMYHFVSPDLSDFTLADNVSLDGGIEFQGITINQVPIPCTVLLFGSGLLGVMGIGRRRMKKS